MNMLKEDITRREFFYGRCWWFKAVTFPLMQLLSRHVVFSQWPQAGQCSGDKVQHVMLSQKNKQCHEGERELDTFLPLSLIGLVFFAPPLYPKGIVLHTPHGKFFCKSIQRTVARAGHTRGTGCCECWFTCWFTSGVQMSESVSFCQDIYVILCGLRWNVPVYLRGSLDNMP